MSSHVEMEVYYMLAYLVKTRVLNEESRKIADKDGFSSHSEVLVTQSRGRSKSRGPGKGERSRSKSKGKYADFVCHHCHEKGHIKWHCEQWKKDKKKKKKYVQKQAYSDSDSEGGYISAVEEIMSLMYEEHDGRFGPTVEERITIVSNDTINLLDSDDMTWIPDSGATIHATSHRELFTNYTAGDFGVVKIGNNDRAQIIRRGDVHLETKNSTTLVRKSVRHVEALQLNIISVRLLDKDGYLSRFGNAQYKLPKGNLIVAKGNMVSVLYYVHAKLSAACVNALQKEDSCALWHKRLGQMSEKGMTVLVKKNLLKGVKDVHIKKCSDCLAGKQHRVAFKSQAPHKKPEVLDLVYSDVCKMSVRSIGGAKYFVTFIDDFSRKVWVYVLNTKDQVLSVFKKFQVSDERETEKKIKCLRTDNGGEYIGPFDAYCKE
jgi:hypothetical protein